MLKKFISLIAFCLAIIGNSNGQINNLVKPSGAKVACDCKNAITINLDKPIVKYGPTIDTSGYGKIQEIPVKQKFSGFYFEEEHNSAWYILKIGFDGNLVFDIKPKVFTDDYDFLLFKYTDTSFCTQFIKRNLVPERSNISANIDTTGLTGLSLNANSKYAIRGVGNNYSEYMPVKKGEKYVLVLDDVTKGGKGHTIVFKDVMDVVFKGIVKDDENNPVKADVAVEGADGVAGYATSDEKTGQFMFHAGMVKGQQYTLEEYSDSTFFYSKQVIAEDTNQYGFQDIKTLLPKLKSGKKYQITNILFVGNQDVMLSESYPTAHALYKLMKRNGKMTIRIEGHVNAPYSSNSTAWQNLSVARAMTVYNYLVKSGISKDRLAIRGFGNSKMLYPTPKNENEEQLNRRVEINVLSIK